MGSGRGAGGWAVGERGGAGRGRLFWRSQTCVVAVSRGRRVAVSVARVDHEQTCRTTNRLVGPDLSRWLFVSLVRRLLLPASRCGNHSSKAGGRAARRGRGRCRRRVVRVVQSRCASRVSAGRYPTLVMLLRAGLCAGRPRAVERGVRRGCRLARASERAAKRVTEGGWRRRVSVERAEGLGGRERGKEERERERAGRGCGMLRSLHERKRENVRWKMFVDILYATSQDKRIPSPIDESPDR